ncbi:MAG: hypothetical protein IJ559_06975 [Prevotella sp.]|nr:hypothetical protein [Prevotella sp.]
MVTATSAAYTITSNTTSEEVKSGSKTITGISKITGFGGQVGRGSGKLNFDNLEIYDYTATVSVTAPTFKFNKVDGAKRNYTITNPNGSGTLYYTTAPADVAPAEGDAAYSSTTEATATVDFSESGTYYAYVLHTNGTTTSPVTPQAVTAGTLTLTAPVFTVTDMVEATDGFFYPVITFASNNSSLEGAPTATFDVASPYTFTSTGSITVTASAEGYTSSSSTFTVNNKYSLSKTIDFGALTASDFDGATWTTATGAPRDYWTSRAAAIPADVTYYKLTNTSATAGDPDNSAVLDGITISNYNQRAPEVYIGYGLLTPYSSISGSSNYMNFKVNGGAATDYIVYNGWNNYGSGTFNTVLAGDATFGLYRYDTMLRTINVYSPASVPVTIPASGYATLASAYNLNLSSVSLFAYTVSSISNTAVTLSPISNNLIPANTGVILTGEAGNYNIDVQADAIEAITGNKLQAAVTATAVEANAAYILQDGEFHIVKNASTIPAGKAYLLATDVPEGARSLTFDFGDATGISAIAKSQEPNANGYYNLAGQRVAQPQKGLYIQDGKKVIIK